MCIIFFLPQRATSTFEVILLSPCSWSRAALSQLIATMETHHTESPVPCCSTLTGLSVSLGQTETASQLRCCQIPDVFHLISIWATTLFSFTIDDCCPVVVTPPPHLSVLGLSSYACIQAHISIMLANMCYIFIVINIRSSTFESIYCIH